KDTNLYSYIHMQAITHSATVIRWGCMRKTCTTISHSGWPFRQVSQIYPRTKSQRPIKDWMITGARTPSAIHLQLPTGILLMISNWIFSGNRLLTLMETIPIWDNTYMPYKIPTLMMAGRCSWVILEVDLHRIRSAMISIRRSRWRVIRINSY